MCKLKIKKVNKVQYFPGNIVIVVLLTNNDNINADYKYRVMASTSLKIPNLMY